MSLPPPADADPGDSIVCLRRWNQTGDRGALDRLLQTEISVLKARIQRRNPNRIAVDMGVSDVAQEAVLRMLRVEKFPQFPNRAALRGYLWRAAWNLLAERMRPRHKSPLRLDSTRMPADVLAQSADSDALEREEVNQGLSLALNLLSDEDRELLQLSYLQGRPNQEIADRLGVAVKALSMRLVRARRRLGEKLRQWSDLIGESDVGKPD